MYTCRDLRRVEYVGACIGREGEISVENKKMEDVFCSSLSDSSAWCNLNFSRSSRGLFWMLSVHIWWLGLPRADHELFCWHSSPSHGTTLLPKLHVHYYRNDAKMYAQDDAILRLKTQNGNYFNTTQITCTLYNPTAMRLNITGIKDCDSPSNLNYIIA